MFALIASALLIVFGLFVVGGVSLLVIVGGVVLWKKRNSAAALVSPLVRKAINDDLTSAIAKKQVDDVKRSWLAADGWALEE